jgi:hypothetical protein
VWTIPAVGLPAFVIAGIALSEDRASSLPGRVAIPAGAVAVLAAVLAFSPPWLSSRLVDRAYDAPTLAGAKDDLRWARRLDPLAVTPLITESALVDSPEDLPQSRFQRVDHRLSHCTRHIRIHHVLADRPPF